MKGYKPWYHHVDHSGDHIALRFEPGFLYRVKAVLGSRSRLRAVHSDYPDIRAFTIANPRKGRTFVSYTFGAVDTAGKYDLIYSGKIKWGPVFEIVGVQSP